MVNLGKMIVNTSIQLSFDIGDFTSWYTDKYDTYFSGAYMRLMTAVAHADYLTEWLVGEVDPRTVTVLDQIDIKTVESSW